MPAGDSHGLSPEELRDWMALRDLEVGQLAAALGVAPMTVTRWRQGYTAPPPWLGLALTAAEADAFAAAPPPMAGGEFAALMDETGWSVSRLATVLGAPRRTIQRWRRPEADVATLAQLALRTATATTPSPERTGTPFG